MSELMTLEELANRSYFFIRFDKRQYLESLRDGHLYMHPTSWHNDLEAKKGIKGQGDKNDGKYILSNITFQMFDCDSNALIASGNAKQAAIFFDKAPIFCMYVTKKENLINTEVNEKDGKIKLSYAFSDALRKYVKENYKNADAAMIISNPMVFLEQIKKYAKIHGIELINKEIRYSDYSINDIDRVHDCAQDLANVYFWKDNFFRLEQEYRILFPLIEIAHHVIYDIGQIQDANIVDLDTFFGMRIDMVFDSEQI